MAEPELTDAEKRKLRRMMAAPAPSLLDKAKPFLAGAATTIVVISGVYFGWVNLRQTDESNQISIQGNQGNVTVEAVFSGPDKDEPGKQKIQTEGKLTDNMLRTQPSYIRLTVKNSGPQKVSVEDIGLQLGGGRMAWATELAEKTPIHGCNPKDDWDNILCEGLFRKEIDGPGAFTFDFPIFPHVDELLQNGGAEPDGIKFKLKTLGAGQDEKEVLTKFHIA
ncbi:hypothetical protein IU443_28665 [Nocardia farcinica]|uniref:hypothetical protein n=1 Tax=Nocardia farcinica TaxID=37329 RepID=UPI001894EF95|nr:hypothetical protein [Nocardia farcinica]MBF6393906.1 hypothetical protein [Nocardia farcinica]